MDTRLLKHYEAELTYLRDMGAEFAESYPKVAARLGMSGLEVVDPYVERLIEGVAFLSARVQLELESQFPMFTNHLLELIYPHYLSPTPSMMIVSFEPDYSDAGLKDGYLLPRNTELQNNMNDGDQTICSFRTAADVTIWPIIIHEVEYIDGRASLLAMGISKNIEAKAAIKLRLKRKDSEKLSELNLGSLSLFISGEGGNAWQLHELLCTDVTGLIIKSTDRRNPWSIHLGAGSVVHKGFSQDEALLPIPKQSFDGYRLIQEYFAMPERFHFVELNGLSEGIKKTEDDDVDIFILLKEGKPELSAYISVDSFDLYSVPAINLFEKRLDRVHVTTKDFEHHVTPDRSAPLDYEVYSISKVVGVSDEGDDDVVFNPFYSSNDLTSLGDSQSAFYTIKRTRRQRTERERLKGARTSYLGSELYLSLVDPDQAPYSSDISQLSVNALVTNRDLPLLLSSGQRDLFHLPDGGPVASISTPVSPTRPRPTLAHGDASWRLISHLSLNYLSLIDSDNNGGAAALRELLGIYSPIGDRAVNLQIEGLISIKSRPIVRRVRDSVLSTAIKGIEIKLTFDDSFFEGSSAFLLSAVLERFFRKYVSINSFTEMVFSTVQRGEIRRWKAQSGLGKLI